MINRCFAGHKNIIRFFIVVGCLLGASRVFAQESGKEIFQQRCTACHRVGGGRLVGPDLAGVGDRHSEVWLLSFIKSSQTLVKSGDPAAKALFDEFKIVMPDHTLSDVEIKSILAYIKETGGAHTASAPTPTNSASEPTQDEIVLGQNLFQGKVRFANGGPSCISCHNVNNASVLGGGILAKGLTTVFSRMGAPGIRAILTSPPFPVMQTAFEGRSFGDNEIRALIAFLQYADKENTLHQPREYGWAMFTAGLGGVLVLLGLYSVLGRRRKRRSVNQNIYDRQIKSE